MTDLLQRLFAHDEDRPLTYAESRSLAAHEDVTVRRTLALRTDLRPEVLYYLAEDADAEVRRNIAGNVTTPARAYLLLTEDQDTDVRLSLAQRIAALAPDLTDSEKDRVREIVHDALERLAHDQIPRVRVMLSETLKDVTNAPAAVINRLARDAEIAVAAPVLTFSTVLSDADLLAIIRENPSRGSLTAIARRQSGLTPPVTDALVEADDAAAIADMLSNRGAQIREETLDALIDRGPEQPEWHEPLVRRPHLHANAAQRLAVYVSDTLVEALMLRHDLPPDDAVAVATEARRRLGARRDGRADLIDYGPDWRETLRTTHARLLAARQGGEEAAPSGDPETLMHAALAQDDATEAIALLAALAGIAPLGVAATARFGSPKGLVSVSWKAGLSPDTAVEIQRRLGRIPPDEVLRPEPDGGWPLDTGTMDWQVEMAAEATL